MKRITKYIALLLGGVVLMGLSACSDDDGRSPSPLVDPNCIGASFGDENTGFEELEDTDPTEITLTVTRDNTKGAATVAIQVLANTENVFKIPATVSFADGKAESELTITFPDAELKEEYTFEIALASEAVNPYKGNGFASFTVQRLKWVDVPGESTFKDWIFAEYNKPDGVNGYKVALQHVEGENRYRIVDPFKEGFDAYTGGKSKDGPDDYLFFSINGDSNGVNFNSYSSGYLIEDNKLTVMGFSPEDYLGVGDVDSKYDPATKKVTFVVYYYASGADGKLLGQNESVLELPVDFELAAEEE